MSACLWRGPPHSVAPARPGLDFFIHQRPRMKSIITWNNIRRLSGLPLRLLNACFWRRQPQPATPTRPGPHCLSLKILRRDFSRISTKQNQMFIRLTVAASEKISFSRRELSPPKVANSADIETWTSAVSLQKSMHSCDSLLTVCARVMRSKIRSTKDAVTGSG